MSGQGQKKLRGSGDIMRQIDEIAANYTPEWDFDPEHPDIGCALSYVYADMLADTLAQFERAAYKHQLALFRNLGAGLLEASPARGHVVFQMPSDAPEGTQAPAFSKMTAEVAEEDGGVAQFETQEDVYVTPARPECLYLTDGQRDGIYCLAKEMEQEKMEPLPLFREKGENLQSHELRLAHREAFCIQGEACLELGFYIRQGKRADERYLSRMADQEAMRFSYWSEEGWQEFDKISALDDRLLLCKSAEQPPFAKTGPQGEETYVVRCQNLDIQKTGTLKVEEISIKGRGSRIKPQYIYGALTECGEGEFFPFGERMNLYEEVYFGSQEALTKRGAKVSLSFQMDFVKIPLEAGPQRSPIEWKWVMKRSEFRPDPEYDLTIEEVVWEYFNGSGWSRLFPGKEHSDAFLAGDIALARQKTITFLCPQDMESILVNSCDACYIRARILKINNLYKLQGNYLSPVIGNVEFSYDYEEKEKRPEWICLKNNLEEQRCTGAEFVEGGSARSIFAGIEEKEKIIYMGFALAPVGAPVRMLWQLKEKLLKEPGSVLWEYYGEKGFREMNLADETCNLSRSGLVTFVGFDDFRKKRLFGRELYWIRLRDESGFYSGRQAGLCYPTLQALYMNAVEARHMEQEETEFFTLGYYEEDCVFRLMRGNIIWIQVEILDGSKEEAVWEAWSEVKNLRDAKEGEKVYEADRAVGTVRFGDGAHGSVPPFGRENGIRIHYKCGGGKKANVAPGKVGKLNQTHGFVTGVSNPMPFWGGMDTELPTEALRRCGARLRHRKRAVTARDYEELALEACRVLEKVRCFGGRNAKGERESGAVTLVAYAKDGQVDLEELERYFKDKMDPGVLKRNQFYVILPKLVEVQVRAEVQVRRFQDVFLVKRLVQEQITAFLDTEKGHFHAGGWNIGQFPHAMQIQNALKEIPQIVRIRKVCLMAFVNGPHGRQEVDPEAIRSHPYILPLSGSHEALAMVWEA